MAIDFSRSEKGIHGAVTIEPAARAVIITDLHGRFYTLRKIMERADVVKHLSRGGCLVVAGDFIHAYDEKDGSIDVLETLIYLKNRFQDNVVLLLGNHEWSHVVNKHIHKGRVNQSGEFVKLLENRYGLKADAKLKEFVSFFSSLPIAARIGNILISHASPDMSVMNMEDFERFDAKKILTPYDRFYPLLFARPRSLGYTADKDAPYIDDDVELFLGRLGLSVSVVGHTRVDKFHSIGKQLIVNSLDGAYLELEPKKYRSVEDLEEAKRVAK